MLAQCNPKFTKLGWGVIAIHFVLSLCIAEANALSTTPPLVCPLQPMKFDTEAPWERNLGCRADIDQACFPSNITSPQEADLACESWRDDNCGVVKGETYWEVYADMDALRCRLYLRHPSGSRSEIDYHPYPGITPDSADTHLIEGEGLHEGCRINFLLHPPAHDGTGPSQGREGCAWFIEGYCPGLVAEDFAVSVSAKRDIHDHHVCALKRHPAMIPLPEYGNCPLHPMKHDGAVNAWERNLGCRADIDQACFPSNITSPQEADFACESWRDDNCGVVKGETYWEVYADMDALRCRLYLRHPSGSRSEIDYHPYPGITPDSADTHLIEGEGLHEGCRINFLLHPPAHDGTGPSQGREGCAWFIEGYCPGLVAEDFAVSVSARRDIHDHHVCALFRIGGASASDLDYVLYAGVAFTVAYPNGPPRFPDRLGHAFFIFDWISAYGQNFTWPYETYSGGAGGSINYNVIFTEPPLPLDRFLPLVRDYLVASPESLVLHYATHVSRAPLLRTACV